ncbi:MAG: GTPase Era [Bacteroidales bacterium]|nr:GTPase Era [Bacteroidales bacterium]
MTHKSGFVNILGNPNVGKSTLMNQLTGEKLSIITAKSQTTRHRIMGIVSGEDFQIVYSDTPGILNPKYRLQESMMRFVDGALEDADLLLYVTDVVEKKDKNLEYLDRIAAIVVPKIIVINKIDLSDNEEVNKLYEYWTALMPDAIVIPISALSRFNIETLLKIIIEKIPEGPPWFPKDQLTDRYERFFVTEIIREKILLHYQKEIPYSVEIEIESYKEEKSITRIAAVIHVARDSQKGIIIGHKGEKIKRVGTEARKDIEAMLQGKVFLELFVKVSKEWRDNKSALKRFGY